MGAQVVELCAVERATMMKVHLAEIEAVLQKSLEALEKERTACSGAEQEVIMLRGQMLEEEESNA